MEVKEDVDDDDEDVDEEEEEDVFLLIGSGLRLRSIGQRSPSSLLESSWTV